MCLAIQSLSVPANQTTKAMGRGVKVRIRISKNKDAEEYSVCKVCKDGKFFWHFDARNTVVLFQNANFLSLPPYFKQQVAIRGICLLSEFRVHFI